ncbi:MAG: Rid family detoxifying hydrolase [Eubacteriales bacterium]
MSTIISTIKAPAAIGPYSQAVMETKGGQLLFISGQLGLQPENGELVAGVEAQANQALSNMKAILAEAGGTLKNVIKTTIFLVDMNDFTVVNKIYGEHFADFYPARSTVAVVALPKGAVFEIEAVACL